MPTRATSSSPWLVCAALGACTFEPWLRADLGGHGDPSRAEGDDADDTDDTATSSGSGTDGSTDADRDGFAAPEDCDDGDAQVFPGQPAYFTEPSAAGSFDYDCSGAAQLEFPSLTTCDPPVCGDVPGWSRAAPVPGCGVQGEWDSGYCQIETEPESPPYCSGGAPTVPRVQACR